MIVSQNIILHPYLEFNYQLYKKNALMTKIQKSLNTTIVEAPLRTVFYP